MTTTLSPPRPERGILLLADISGYTAFLGRVAEAHPDMTEVAPAYPVLSGMLDTVVEAISPTFTLAKLEGDAVFAYAPGDRLTGAAEELIGIVRRTHEAFRSRVEEAMVVHYHPCTACTLLPTLDLKFVIHEGSFVVQPIAGHEELVGPTVNAVHRLLKNSITERTGKRAYLFVSEAAASRLGLTAAQGLPHRERYADIGEIRGLVIDLSAGPP